ncbi:hypothetical protein ASAC_0866 [Acidilobus saccharovorans 345-15]|uniref:Uncharacterized protein n=1 Tax=Acidilobus saccharovorans (strain DSM 16705 / JCM 18335 / VKM B-2471 / 345-15) TaxID=666510 RepID=D9Q1T4_ACIS3|nr:hypothetical protein [Acidilobus saccharovorans]ADL19272.1 hypothetical protein ASAC_0866 [Acidilobus saccharovorans 345-15]
MIGVAKDEEELLTEMKRLSEVDPKAVEYHLAQGHIRAWLDYIGRGDLASLLSDVKSLADAVKLLSDAMLGWDSELTCPGCGFKGKVRDFKLLRPPWYFGKYLGRSLQCPRCGLKFRYFYPLAQGGKPYTVPKGKGM